MRKIKIISCSDPQMWYANKIGEIKTIVLEEEWHYWCREDSGLLNIVHKSDAQIIESVA